MTETEKYRDKNVPHYTPHEVYKDFEKFSTAMKDFMDKAHGFRKNTQPKPARSEYDLGTYIEDIEPPMRHAILTFYKKGYDLITWGTEGFENHVQSIRGNFVISEVVHEKLEQLGVRTGDINFDGNKGTEIFFLPEKPQGKLIEEKWNQIADVFPTISQQKSFQRYTKSAEKFRSNFKQLFCEEENQVPPFQEKVIFGNEIQERPHRKIA